MAQEVGPRLPLIALGSAALLAPLSRVDASLLDEIQEGYRGPVGSYLDVTNELGGPRMTAVAAGAFAATLVTNDTRLQDAAFTSFQSLVYAGALTGTLKTVAGRIRPEDHAGSYQFDLFSGNTSFPSGHTTAAFAIVTPWVYYYPGPITYSLFALSTGTAVARIARDKHWPTDVLAGGAIGFMTARYLSKRHQGYQQEQRERLSISPTVAPDAIGFNLRLRLN